MGKKFPGKGETLYVCKLKEMRTLSINLSKLMMQGERKEKGQNWF